MFEICSPIELVNLSKFCFEFSNTSVMPFIVRQQWNFSNKNHFHFIWFYIWYCYRNGSLITLYLDSTLFSTILNQTASFEYLCNISYVAMSEFNSWWTSPLLISLAFRSILSFKAVNCFKISSSFSFKRVQTRPSTGLMSKIAMGRENWPRIKVNVLPVFGARWVTT